MGRISEVYRQDTSIRLLVQLDQGMNVSNYLITITCISTGETSPDLGWVDDPANPHWSRAYTFTNLQPGTQYTFTAYVSQGISVPARSYTTTGTASTRPQNWKWTTAQNANGHKISGASFSMLASEWNSFTQRINAFRQYKGLTAYSFSPAYSGNQFIYHMFNEAIVSINDMNLTGIGTVSKDSLVYASNFNSLMNALNGIT